MESLCLFIWLGNFFQWTTAIYSSAHKFGISTFKRSALSKWSQTISKSALFRPGTHFYPHFCNWYISKFHFFQCTVQLWRKDLLTCFWLYKGVWFLELLKLGRIIVHFLNIFSTWNLDNSHCQCMLISLALDPPFFLLMTSLLFQKMVILNFCYITKWMCISKHIRFLNLIKFFWCKRTF